MNSENPLADRRVRSFLGISGAVIIAVVAIFFLDGPIRYLVLGIAALDAIVTPYLLGRAIETQ